MTKKNIVIGGMLVFFSLCIIGFMSQLMLPEATIFEPILDALYKVYNVNHEMYCNIAHLKYLKQ